MTNRVVHQEYLEAWLRGDVVEAAYSISEDWNVFSLETHEMSCFNNKSWCFRMSKKTVEVNLKDFYKEYDDIRSASYREVLLEELIEKYLPRP